MKLIMDKYKSFYGTLLIIIILLNFVSVCATNGGSKKSKNTYGSDSGSGANTSKSGGDEETPKPTDSSSSPSRSGTPSTPLEGGAPSTSPSSPSRSGTPSTPSEGGAPSAPSPSPVPPPEGGKTSPSKSPEGGIPPSESPKGEAPPAGGTPLANPPTNTPGGENNVTILAYVLFSSTPKTTTVGRPQVKGLISLYQPPSGNTVVTGNIGAKLDRVNGNYKFTIKDNNGTIFYDCTGRVNPLFIGQASLFSFTWNYIQLSGPYTAIGKHFVIEESNGILADGLITMEYEA